MADGAPSPTLCGAADGARRQSALRRTASPNSNARGSGVRTTAFLRGLVARSLSGMRLVISDARPVSSMRSPRRFPAPPGRGVAPVFLATCSRGYPSPPVRSSPRYLARSAFAQPVADAVQGQLARVCGYLAERFPAAAEMLSGALPDVLAFGSFPGRWGQI
jgi:putative transposase